MWKNYLRTAFRSFNKQRGYAAINVLGLTVGLTACILLFLYVREELRVDQHHVHAEQLYRVNLVAAMGGTDIYTANTSVPLGPTFIEEFPEVLNAVRFREANSLLVQHDDQMFYEDRWVWTDPSVFEVFTFPLLQGDAATALAEPNTVVISESTARKYFGDADPMGKVLVFDTNAEYRVTGVMQDAPATARLGFNFLASFVTLDRSRSTLWIQNSIQTYLLLDDDADPVALEAKLPALVRKYVAPQVEQAMGQSFDDALAAGLRFDFALEALPNIYLHSTASDQIGNTSDIAYIYTLTAVALFILLIACINFMNLATARSAGRAREVGVRKVLGSLRRQLITQFLSEAVLMAGVAFVLAIGLAWALTGPFSSIAGRDIVLFSAENAGFLLSMTGVALAAGLLAGLYPSLVLSAFQPVAVLKGAFSNGARRPWLRNALVVTQFAISIALLVGTGVVYQQLDFMQQKRLGFSGDQVLVLPIETREAQQRFDAFRQELLALPGVDQVAGTSATPGRFNNTSAFRPTNASSDQVYALEVTRVSYDFVSTLGIEMASGRDFSRDFGTDEEEAFLLNEAAATAMGLDAATAPGTSFMEVGSSADDHDYGTIVGIVEDFHFESLHHSIRPMVLQLRPAEAYGAVLVKLSPDLLAATLPQIQPMWEAFEPGYPYRSLFLDEDFGRVYAQEQRLGQIFTLFTLLAIFTACLGLFGLASFVTAQRTKEIGVRKVLGASTRGIVVMLTKEFTVLVGVAMLLAFPVAFLLMRSWLSDFAYHVQLGVGVFLIAGLLALLTAWLTVGYQSLRAAHTNPVKALRTE